MWFFSLLVLGIFGTSQTAVAFGSEELMCETDRDCPENTFCYETSHLCATCKPNYCSRFNRANSSWRKCHKEAKECGGCLEGYSEEILTDGTVREACISSPVSEKHGTYLHSVMPGDNHSISSYLIYSGIAAVFGFIVVAVMAMYLRRNGYPHVPLQPSSSVQEDNFSRSPNGHLGLLLSVTSSQMPKNYHLAPPPYVATRSTQQLSSGNTEEGGPLNQRSHSCGQVGEYPLSLSPSAPLLLTSNDGEVSPHSKCYEESSIGGSSLQESPVSIACCTAKGLVQCEKTHLLQARPFRGPSYENVSHSGSEDGTSSSEENEEESSDFENPNLDDEATLPCTWTPASTSTSAVPIHNDEICNTPNGEEETRTKRVSSSPEAPDSGLDSGSERKRMKTHQGSDVQSVELEDRPFRCFSQSRNLSDQHQRTTNEDEQHQREENSD